MEDSPFGKRQDGPLRGTLALPLSSKVLFSQEVEVEIEKLPRWQPRVIIDRRSLEPCSATAHSPCGQQQ